MTRLISHTMHRVEERLDEYSQRFDVVLLGDGGLSDVNALLQEIIFGKAGKA